jgi:hypothetical protein
MRILISDCETSTREFTFDTSHLDFTTIPGWVLIRHRKGADTYEVLALFNLSFTMAIIEPPNPESQSNASTPQS